MEKSSGIADLDLDKSSGKGVKIFLAFLVVFFLSLYFFVLKPSENSEAPIKQNTEQTVPAPASQ